jgi:putative hydrolase of the HAD superfamily
LTEWSPSPNRKSARLADADQVEKKSGRRMQRQRFAAVRCVVFDIDDTLYLERDYVKSGFAAVDEFVRTRFGSSGFGDAAWAAFERGVRGTTFNEALAECGVTANADDLAALVAAYRDHAPRISLLPDAAACLGSLEGRAALGLARWCEPILLTAALGTDRGKPHPFAFEEVERLTGFRGEACLYVADNPAKDFAGPRSLGWRTIRVRRPLGLHFSVDGPVCWDLEMADLGSLADLLNLGNRGE